MADATISRVRLRDLARLGRSGPATTGGAGLRRACASPSRSLTDAAGIGKRPPRCIIFAAYDTGFSASIAHELSLMTSRIDFPISPPVSFEFTYPRR